MFNLDRSQRQSQPDFTPKSQLDFPIFSLLEDDIDDFQIPLTQTTISQNSFCSQEPLKPSNLNHPQSKRPKRSTASSFLSKENVVPSTFQNYGFEGISSFSKHKMATKSDCILSFGCDTFLLEKGARKPDENCSLDFIPSTIDCGQYVVGPEDVAEDSVCGVFSSEAEDEKKSKIKEGYFRNSIESKLLASGMESFNNRYGKSSNADANNDSEAASELDLLLNFCSELDEVNSSAAVASPHQDRDGLHVDRVGGPVRCPLCGSDISDLTEEQRHIHTNDCIDRGESKAQDIILPEDEKDPQLVPQVLNVSPVVDWLHNLGLAKYEDVFVREEVDWDTLQRLTEEDLLSMGISALGPRKKIVHALCEIRKGIASSDEKREEAPIEPRRIRTQRVKQQNEQSEKKVDETSKPAANKLITDYFPGSVTSWKKNSAIPSENLGTKNNSLNSGPKQKTKIPSTNRKSRDVPKWCCIPGTPFRVVNTSLNDKHLFILCYSLLP